MKNTIPEIERFKTGGHELSADIALSVVPEKECVSGSCFSSATGSRQRSRYVDLLTVLSAFAVVMLHANGVYWRHPKGALWISANCIESIFYFAVPMFFMISGATLIDFKERYSTREFFWRRFFRVGIPFLFWSILSVIVYGDLSCQDFRSSAFLIKFAEGIYNSKYMAVYWFFFPLFLIYLSIPFLASVQDKKKNFRYIIIWSLICITATFVMNLLKLKYRFNVNIYKISPVISAYPLLFPLLGYYLAKCTIPKRYRMVLYVAGIVGTLAHIVGTILLSPPGSPICGVFKGYSNVPALLQTSALFVWAQNVDFDHLPKFVIKLLDFVKPYTFFVYLGHMYFIDYVMNNHNVFFRSLCFRTIGVLIIFILLILIGWLLCRFKIGRIITGNAALNKGSIPNIGR